MRREHVEATSAAAQVNRRTSLVSFVQCCTVRLHNDLHDVQRRDRDAGCTFWPFLSIPKTACQALAHRAAPASLRSSVSIDRLQIALRGRRDKSPLPFRAATALQSPWEGKSKREIQNSRLSDAVNCNSPIERSKK
jgi:hypothetical protein